MWETVFLFVCFIFSFSLALRTLTGRVLQLSFPWWQTAWQPSPWECPHTSPQAPAAPSSVSEDPTLQVLPLMQSRLDRWAGGGEGRGVCVCVCVCV